MISEKWRNLSVQEKAEWEEKAKVRSARFLGFPLPIFHFLLSLSFLSHTERRGGGGGGGGE